MSSPANAVLTKIKSKRISTFQELAAELKVPHSAEFESKTMENVMGVEQILWKNQMAKALEEAPPESRKEARTKYIAACLACDKVGVRLMPAKKFWR